MTPINRPTNTNASLYSLCVYLHIDYSKMNSQKVVNPHCTYQPHYDNNTSCEGDESQKQGSSLRPAVVTAVLLTPWKKMKYYWKLYRLQLHVRNLIVGIPILLFIELVERILAVLSLKNTHWFIFRMSSGIRKAFTRTCMSF